MLKNTRIELIDLDPTGFEDRALALAIKTLRAVLRPNSASVTSQDTYLSWLVVPVFAFAWFKPNALFQGRARACQQALALRPSSAASRW